MAYLLAITSAALYGGADFIGGLATRRANAIAVVLLSQAGGLLLVALILPLLPHASPSRPDLFWGAVGGLTGGIGVALLYRALAIGTMAVVAPTTAVCAVAIPVLFSVLLGERPPPLALIGIALAAVSIVLVSQDRTARLTDRDHPTTGRTLPVGVGTALASGVAIGLFFLSFARTGPAAGMWPLLVARMVSVSLFVILAIAGARSLRMPGKVATLAIAAGIVDVTANAFYLLATRLGALSIVVTLSSLYPAGTVLLARIVLKERLNGWQISGVGCAMAAVWLMVSSTR